MHPRRRHRHEVRGLSERFRDFRPSNPTKMDCPVQNSHKQNATGFIRSPDRTVISGQSLKLIGC